jgi:hypothetical protein
MSDEPKTPAGGTANARFLIDDLIALDDATLLAAVAEAHPVDTILLCSASGGHPLAERLLLLCPDAIREVLSASVKEAAPTDPLVALLALSNFRTIVQSLRQRMR